MVQTLKPTLARPAKAPLLGYKGPKAVCRCSCSCALFCLAVCRSLFLPLDLQSKADVLSSFPFFLHCLVPVCGPLRARYEVYSFNSCLQERRPAPILFPMHIQAHSGCFGSTDQMDDRTLCCTLSLMPHLCPGARSAQGPEVGHCQDGLVSCSKRKVL